MNRGGKIIGKELKITPGLATLEREHNKYLANQPIWNQYVVWMYTLGSQPVNRRLTGIPTNEVMSQKWTFELFNNFKYGLDKIGYNFKKWIQYFKNPKLYVRLNATQKNIISNQTLNEYSKNLQSIILKAPITKSDIVVYKSSTPYDERLLQNNYPYEIKQSPFNSTTYDPWFDFNSFLGSSQDICCLWEIMIPRGSHVLAIAHPFQAYLTEREILLPYNSSFEVLGSQQVLMSYWGTREAPEKVQSSPYYIGEVYRHDNWDQKQLLQRNMKMLLAIFKN